MTQISPSRVIVDLRAYAHNLKQVRLQIPQDCGIIAIVKANAYGHGAVKISERALAEGVAMLGVATVDEAIELRDAGITAPILVLVQPSSDAFAAIVEYNLRPMISDAAAAEKICDIARRTNKVVPIHCKVDSGMGRQGFEIDQAVRNMLFLTRIPNIDIEGVATHFPVADLKQDQFTANQIKSFKFFLKQLDKSGVPYEMSHCANSAAILNYPASAFSMVRPGLMTYGVWPLPTPSHDGMSQEAAQATTLEPVLRWETRVVLVKDLDPGSSVGYGRTYTTTSRMRAAILPVGYADGYKHALSNCADVLIRGTRCPVRGSVCMDQMIIDISHVPEVAVGDVATLIGVDGDETITADELARHAQSIPYDILAGIGHRVYREYVG